MGIKAKPTGSGMVAVATIVPTTRKSICCWSLKICSFKISATNGNVSVSVLPTSVTEHGPLSEPGPMFRLKTLSMGKKPFV